MVVIIIDNIRSALHVYQTILSNVEITCTCAIYKFFIIFFVVDYYTIYFSSSPMVYLEFVSPW